MPRSRSAKRLKLGPIVGHTDDSSTKIWIQVSDDPSRYALRVEGAGLFPFVSTEVGQREFGTAVAKAVGLRPDWSYKYRVVRMGRFVPEARGSVRTMPSPSSMTPILFCAISCNGGEEDGVWKNFAEFVEKSQPSFILMMGDQVYLDEDEPDIFAEHFDSKPPDRRQAMADKYRLNWSREPLRTVLANVPVYMMWDDHDVRDGWGSSAADSPTMVAKFPKGAEIFRKSTAYFEDARDVYFHFQGCRNPLQGEIRKPGSPFEPDSAFPNYIFGPPPSGIRRAMPFVFRCGRTAILALDSRGDRDVFRSKFPVLGQEQWQFIDQFFATLPPDIEALAVVTPTPIASVDPHGTSMKALGDRTDDIEAFKRGDEKGTLHLDSPDGGLDTFVQAVGVLASAKIFQKTGFQPNWGNFKISNIDEARDQWSHKFARSEQEDLIRKTGRARLSNRTAGSPRGVIFLSGDIHIGAVFEITCRNPSYKVTSLTSSGISKVESAPASIFVGVFVDEDFAVAPGIHSTLSEVIPDFNFGVVQVQPTGNGAVVLGSVAHEGNAFAAGVDIADLI